MRVLLALCFLNFAHGQKVGVNVPCNKELDGLLTIDPDGDERAFMSCQSVGVGNVGYWERKVCPNNMVFDFMNQQCKEQRKKARKPQSLNIAILNNSCANGETCIGGSVCDLDTLRCMCPYGTTPKIDTLSCESNSPPFVSATVDSSSQLFNSYSAANKNIINPFPPQSPEFKPNKNAFNFNNFNNNFIKSTMNNNNNNNKFNWNSNIGNGMNSWPSTNQNSNNNNNDGNDFNNGFRPNPNQKFVFNFNKNTMPIEETTLPDPTTSKMMTLAFPGDSCKSNEMCVGGSICTLPIGICLCPGDLEARDGECVLPAASTIAVQKVGIGAICSDLAECDHGSSCVMGRCACVSPLIQHEGKCVLRQEQKLVGPGELCDNGEICTKGSVCDLMIPVCVCPSDTDLHNGECITVASFVTNSPVQTPTTTTTTAPPPPAIIPISTVPPPKPMQPMVIEARPPIQPIQPVQPAQPVPPFQPTYSTHVPTNLPNIFSTITPPAPKSSLKVNQMKIGGSKQAGVGVRCLLNTDCMIGAYCNGNTNPPSCRCLSTHVNIEGRCEKVIYPGQVGCRSDLQCHAAYTGTHCIDRICVCPEGQRAVDQTCVAANEPVTSPPGGSCSNLRECTGGSVCKEGWCICPDPSMIASKGICIQSGPRPTLPPYTTVNVPKTKSQTTNPPVQTTNPHVIVTNSPQRKKIVPGGKCGPFDTCVGGSSCIEGHCLCPAGQQPASTGRCERIITSVTPTTPRHTTASNARAYARPGETCISDQVCVGGSHCSSKKVCECPAETPIISAGRCVPANLVKEEVIPGGKCDENSLCTKGSKCHNGLCRCSQGFIAVAGNCVALPTTTTTTTTTTTQKSLKSVKPLESCDNNEICEGGSSCDDDTGICMCPPGQIVFNELCMPPPTQAQIKQMTTAPSVATKSTFKNECINDSNCGENKVCVVGKCTCRPGFVDNGGKCESLEDIEVGERPVPVSYAKHKVLTMPAPEPVEVPSPQAQDETQKPRIVGPPIRRPKPKNKSSSSSGNGSGGGSKSYKTSSGNGNCPPGNEPTRDSSSGKLIMCNGLEPNCPPRSYCYITSGGFATEEYNCCKSW